MTKTKKNIVFEFALIALSLFSPNAIAEDVREAYGFFNGVFYGTYEILGVTKEEAIANAISDISANKFALIAEFDYANSNFIITKDGQIQDVQMISAEIANCYRFPRLPISPYYVGMTDNSLIDIRLHGVKVDVSDDDWVWRGCTATYSAWYNTTMINYAFIDRKIFSQYRSTWRNNPPEFCSPNYILEHIDIFQLWDSSGNPAPGIPEYPFGKSLSPE
jgi:hypothetical protein